ncbi:hypothetical protein ANCCAN_23150 [Ancylostoma caninum]|uniref:Uncharacterized protein n=1 Tax=Ancylostoma caninum TaxID=29170 RepID=A0A368FHQ9_ANCCA|nr:hypothetical protein ANCCAN_23150 [Ancylostoma caninum]
MPLSSGLVFAALCFLCIASSANLKGDVPKCEQLGKEGLKEEERKSVVDQINKALKKAASTVSCGLCSCSTWLKYVIKNCFRIYIFLYVSSLD